MLTRISPWSFTTSSLSVGMPLPGRLSGRRLPWMWGGMTVGGVSARPFPARGGGGRGLPLGSVGVGVVADRGGVYPRTAAGAARGDVAAVADRRRVGEVLVQVVDVLDHAALPAATDREE